MKTKQRRRVLISVNDSGYIITDIDRPIKTHYAINWKKLPLNLNDPENRNIVETYPEQVNSFNCIKVKTRQIEYKQYYFDDLENAEDYRDYLLNGGK